MSDGEALLWSQIKSRQIGFHVRRQYCVGPYFLDFYIEAAKLCVEVDGKMHDLRGEQDLARDEFLEARGIRTIRIDAKLLWDDLITQVDWVHATACERAGFNPLDS